MVRIETSHGSLLKWADMGAQPTSALKILHQQVDARVQQITASQDSWPCRQGCDACCRRLARLPILTTPEWELLHKGFRLLSPATRAEILQRIDDMREASRPLVCPLLDSDSGSCLVYEHRPVACRTYGFYVERDSGLYCGIIDARVQNGELASVVWGNNSSIEHQLRSFGPTRGLVALFDDLGQSSGMR